MEILERLKSGWDGGIYDVFVSVLVLLKFCQSQSRCEVSGRVYAVPCDHLSYHTYFFLSHSSFAKKALGTTLPEWMNLSRVAMCWQFTPVVPANIHSCGHHPLPSPRASCVSLHWAHNSTWIMSRLKSVSWQKCRALWQRIGRESSYDTRYKT